VLAGVGGKVLPKGATAIVVDPRTSQILAMRTGRRSTPPISKEASNEDLMNRATGFNYEPGSTFKGVHGLGGAGRKTGDADDRISPCRRRSGSPTERSKTPRNAAPKT